jgi:hypothetical protein
MLTRETIFLERRCSAKSVQKSSLCYSWAWRLLGAFFPTPCTEFHSSVVLFLGCFVFAVLNSYSVSTSPEQSYIPRLVLPFPARFSIVEYSIINNVPFFGLPCISKSSHIPRSFFQLLSQAAIIRPVSHFQNLIPSPGNTSWCPALLSLPPVSLEPSSGLWGL